MADNKERISSGRERKRRRISPYAWIALGVTVVVTLLVVLLLSPLLNIETVDVKGEQVLTEDKVLKLAYQPVGTNIFAYDKKAAIQSLESYPYIKTAEISRHLPHALSIRIIERKPVGVLLNKSFYLQFSEDGRLLDSTKTISAYNLPLITGISLNAVPQPGEIIKDKSFKEALVIVNAMGDDLLKTIQEINIGKKDNITAYTANGLEIKIGNADHIESRMRALADILNQVVITQTVKGDIEYIDMRYKGAPVLKVKGENAMPVETAGPAQGSISAQQEAQPVQGTTQAAPAESD